MLSSVRTQGERSVWLGRVQTQQSRSDVFFYAQVCVRGDKFVRATAGLTKPVSHASSLGWCCQVGRCHHGQRLQHRLNPHRDNSVKKNRHRLELPFSCAVFFASFIRPIRPSGLSRSLHATLCLSSTYRKKCASSPLCPSVVAASRCLLCGLFAPLAASYGYA